MDVEVAYGAIAMVDPEDIRAIESDVDGIETFVLE